MTDVSHATPGPLPPPPPRSGHGCLWGCLVAAIIAVVAIVGVVSYTGWFLFSGFKDNATLKTAIVEVNRDQTARSVLGDRIEITSLSSSNYSTDMSAGTVESYIANVKGSKAEGRLEVHAVTPPHGEKLIDVLTLTGPDGRKYSLVGGTAPTPPAPGSI